MPDAIIRWTIPLRARGSAVSRRLLLEEIWNRYHRRLILFVRPMVKGDAEDLVQDIMLRVCRNIHTYRPSYAFSTWIYTIARNACLNHLEKKRRITWTDEMDAFPSEPDRSPEKRTIEADIQRRINLD